MELIFILEGKRPKPPTSTPVGGTEWKRVCVVTNVASFLVLGGGQDNQNVPTKCTQLLYCTLPQKHIFSGLKIHLPTSMNMRASELRNCSHFHMLKLLFSSIFCWYFRYFVSETFSLYHLYDTIINDSIPTKH